MTDSPLTTMDPDLMEDVLAVARVHDPEVVSVLVLHGSPLRGLAVSHWTAFEGPDAERRGLALVMDAVAKAAIQAAEETSGDGDD